MLAVVLGSGVVFLDATVVSVALQKIGEELPSTVFGVLEAQSYIYNAYLLTLSALLILAGALTDFYGRKKTFAWGLLAFGITSVMCGLAPNMELLILFRLLQGAAGAFLVPGSLAIIRASFEGEEQGRAFGLWAGASGATAILGPVIGGFLVDSISWRAAFFINAPLLLLAFYATTKHIEETRDEEASGSFDWLGAAVIALAIGGLAFGGIRGQETQWKETSAFIALGVGGAATLVFPILMARRKNPLVPLELFKSRNFTVTNIATFLIYGALYVSGYFTAIFLQGTIGYTPTSSGAGGIPAVIPLVFFSTAFGKFASRYGPRIFMTVGPLLMGLGLMWLARFPSTSEPWILSEGSWSVPPADYFVDVFPAWVIFGIGLVIMVAPLTTALMTSVDAHHSGVGSAINNAISRVGPQLLGALIFIAVSASFYSNMAERVSIDVSSSEVRQQVPPLNPPDESAESEIKAAAKLASTESYRIAMLSAAALLLLGAAVNGFGIRNPERETETPTISAAAGPVAEASS